MKTIISGSNHFTSSSIIGQAVDKCDWTVTEVVCESTRGVGQLGQLWAVFNNIPVKEFHDTWNANSETVVYKRNLDMINYADALIAIWDGNSGAIRQLIDLATAKGLKVYVHQL